MRMIQTSIIAVSFLAFGLIGCSSSRHYQAYDRADVLSYLKTSTSFKDLDIDFNYWQDCTGNAVYIAAKSDLVIVLRQDLALPIVVKSPPDEPLNSWIDPDGHILNLPDFAVTGKSLWNQTDFQTGLFFETGPQQLVRVGNFKKRDRWLFQIKLPADFGPSQIFGCGDKIYLLDHRDYADPGWAHDTKNCLEFSPSEIDRSQFTLLRRFRLPVNIRFCSPKESLAIGNSYGRLPFPSHLVLYDLSQTREVIGLDDRMMYLFVEGNWLKDILQKKTE